MDILNGFENKAWLLYGHICGLLPKRNINQRGIQKVSLHSISNKINMVQHVIPHALNKISRRQSVYLLMLLV